MPKPGASLKTAPPAAATAAAREPGKDEVRRRAYELYLARGAAPGREVEDWVRAERELRAQGPTPPRNGPPSAPR